MSLGTILGYAAGYAGGMNVAQATSALLVLGVINSGVSVLAGGVIIGQGVYFGGRLIYRIIETGSGMLIEKINNLRETKELKHSTVNVAEEDFVLLDYYEQEVVEIDLKELTLETFDQLDTRKLYRFIGNQ